MTKLSVNINKIATLRNVRGGDMPNVKEAAIKSQEFGAQGITVHPRPMKDTSDTAMYGPLNPSSTPNSTLKEIRSRNLLNWCWK